MKYNVLETRDGLKIMVTHAESDSLAIIEVTHTGRYGKLSLRTGLRGNWSADRRPIQWVYSSMVAPLLSAAQIAENKARYWRRHSGGRRCCCGCCPENQR